MIGVEKAAILLTTLGPEAAAAVFRHLSEPEVRQVSAAIARLRSIPREQAAAVHEEAWRRLTEREGLLVDGERFARQMIAAETWRASGSERWRKTAAAASGPSVVSRIAAFSTPSTLSPRPRALSRAATLAPAAPRARGSAA